LGQLKRILDLVREHDLAELEVEHDGLRLKVRRHSAGGSVSMPVAAAAPAANAPAVQPAAASAAPGAPPPAAATVEPDSEIELAVVKSPIVGTFYRSPEPNAASFVEIGTAVKKGQVLCIIEAMKLMNEIDSEYDGEVVNIYVENGQPVQYGERLFAIRTR
jgi:acetyl-CoA carboxylase biotin carboxyl carrier protein